jgi:hypothetical protein
VKPKIRLHGCLKVYKYITKSETSIFILGAHTTPSLKKKQRITIIQINNTTLRFPIDILSHTCRKFNPTQTQAQKASTFKRERERKKNQFMFVSNRIWKILMESFLSIGFGM